jgi:hypothetical protein
MSETSKESRTQGWLVAAVIAVLAPVLLYVGGYMLFPTEERAVGYDRRVYTRWLAGLYAPAARVESTIRGFPVNLRYKGEFDVVPNVQ